MSKFHEDRTKIVYFLLIVTFLVSAKFPRTPSTYSPRKVFVILLCTNHFGLTIGMPRPKAHNNFEVRRIFSVINTVHSDTLAVNVPPNSATNLTSWGFSYPVIMITGLDLFFRETEAAAVSGVVSGFDFFVVVVDDLAEDLLDAVVTEMVKVHK